MGPRARNSTTRTLAVLVTLLVLAGQAQSLPLRQGQSADALDPSSPPIEVTWPGTTADSIDLPLDGFLENRGQLADASVRFYAWSPSGGVAITDAGAIITLVDGDGAATGCNVRLDFEGASTVVAEGRSPLPGVTNILKGRDAAGWRSGLRTYREVVLPGIYPGIDAVYRLDRGHLKYDLVLRPSTDVASIRVAVSGHDMMTVDGSGDLLVGTPAGTLRDSGLVAFYQDEPSRTVDASFRLLGDDRYGFALGDVEPGRAVVIDPLIYSTFVGGSQGELELPWGGVVIGGYRSYVTGFANSTDFPTTPGAFQRTYGGGDGDVFVFCLSADGSTLEWSTYVGGDGDDYPHDIVLGTGDRIIVVGRTNSTDMPASVGAVKPTHSGPDQDGFVMELVADGSSVLFGTYLGGSDTDEITSVLVRGEAIVVAGNTMSTDLPTHNWSLQQNHSGGGFDVFLASLTVGLDTINWMTYWGGSLWDLVNDMDLTSWADIVLVGQTRSEDLATNGSYQQNLSGDADAIIARLSGDGSLVQWASYLGGEYEDVAQYVSVSNSDDITIAGYTESSLFPTTNGSYQEVPQGSADVFVSVLSANGSVLEASTFFGGSDWDTCEGFDVGPSGTVYLTGRTLSDDLPTLQGTHQMARAGNYDAYVTRLSGDCSYLMYCSYLGGSAMDVGYGVAVDDGGNATLVGGTESTDFPSTPGAYQTAHGGRVDVFVTRMDLFLDLERPVAVPGPDIVIQQHDLVVFNGSGSTDNVGVVNWTWTFNYGGEDVTLHGPVVEWTFDLAGYYYVWLKVRDAVGLEGLAWVSVHVGDIEPPEANAPPDFVGQQHWNVTMDGGDSRDNLGIHTWNWTFVYNSTPVFLEGEVAHFTFHDAGVYEVMLSVADAAGNSDADTFTITIMDIEDPVADAGPNLTVGQHVTVVLDGSGSRDNVGIVNFTWQFVYAGAPIALYGEVASFRFDRSGVYDVTLLVEDDMGNRGFDRSKITVLDTTPPVAVAGFDTTVDQGATVPLDASASSDDVGIVTWTWAIHFGEEVTTFPGQKNAITFNAAGIHVVTLNVSDAAGNWDVASFQVIVRDIEPPVAEAGETQVVEQGATVTLNGTGSTDNVGIISWTWTFRDGGRDVTLTGPEAEHTFDTVGTYLVTLTVLDGSGLSAIDQTQVIVKDSEPPVARPGDPVRVLLGERVTFNGSASSDNMAIETYSWTFAYNQGPVELNGPDPSFTFELRGTYRVTLTVTDPSGNQHSAETTVEVYSPDDGGGGGSAGGTTLGDLLPWLLAAALVVVVAVVALVTLGRRTGRSDDDLGWAPTDEEIEAREGEGPEDGDAGEGSSGGEVEGAEGPHQSS